MASSSVSQESLDMEDFETTRQRNRIRTHRGRGMFYRGDRDGGDHVDREGRDQNGEGGEGHPTSFSQDHDSPTRTVGRSKDKRSRPNHLHKGKLPKDKRKLREKRRSTGVVHLPSTELSVAEVGSTGDSLDEDDDDDKVAMETKKNTAFNEITDKNKPVHERHDGHSHHSSTFTTRRNKSPSDLEADLEDNQDYDSTVSHSETNLTLIGRSESSDTHMSQSLLDRPVGISKFTRCSPESTKSFTSSHMANISDQEAKGSVSSMNTSSVLSRYRESEAPLRDIDQNRSNISKMRDNKTESSYGYLSSRFRDKDQSHGSSRLNYHVPRPFMTQNNDNAASLEKVKQLLEKEKEENKRLQQLLEDKDRRIAELEKEVSLLNKELDEVEDENIKLEEDKSALIKAMSQLSTNV
ncbi:PRKC apoptosis WT1 regulator protein-like isoform X1 [Haliotis cracherodii]|uniref:PRKC apoptosis WT1 regulator protein-like isoform X1 n=1 Tax=Haliotis cracherodii TaxID=6455 RepID=UPI0039E9552D